MFLSIVKDLSRNVRRRFRKALSGWYTTFGQRAKPMPPAKFWDRGSTLMKSEADTIAPGYPPLAAAYHYASLEAPLSRALHYTNRYKAGHILDIGSGAGHWIQYFREIYPELDSVTACEISETRCDYLAERFKGDSRIRILHASADEIPTDREYDVVSLLGCAFHIVNEPQLVQTFERISKTLAPGGVIVLNDLLPVLAYGNQYQVTDDGIFYTKKVRPARHWRRIANSNGLKAHFLRNYAWLFAPRHIPEGHIIFMAKESVHNRTM